MEKIAVLLILVFWGMLSNAQLTMQKNDDGILIVDGEKKVLQFQAEPKSKDGAFERCNYIHPLWGLDGQVLTEDFPADHLHHRGVFWAWHQVWIGEKQIGDPWLIEDFEQEVIELEFVKQTTGSVQIKTEVDWQSNKWTKNGKKIPYLKEHTIITVHSGIGNYRKIDFEIRLLALAENLKIGGSEDPKGYSGFSIRMALPNDIKFFGQQGELTPEVTAVQSAGFVNMAGSIGANGKKGGVVIVDNSENPAYPQPWILRTKKSMQNVVYPGSKTVQVSTSKPLVLKYSLLVYSGKLTSKKISKICNF